MQKNIEDYHKDNNIQYKTKLKDIGKYIEDKNERIVNNNNQNIECSSNSIGSRLICFMELYPSSRYPSIPSTIKLILA